MFFLILTLMVPQASGLIDCEEACNNCKDQSGETAIIEVYCSMCEECRDRRGYKDRQEHYRRENHREEDHRREDHKREDQRREDHMREDHMREDHRKQDQRREDQRREDQRREEQRKEDQRREHHRREDHIDYLPDRVKYEQYSPSPALTRSTFNIYRNILNQFATAHAFDYFDGTPAPRKRSSVYPKTMYREIESDHDSDSDFLQAKKKRNLRYEEEMPQDCPTPPECTDEEDVVMIDDHHQDHHPEATRPSTTTESTTTTTRTTTTQPKRTCPPIRNCRPKKGNNEKNRESSTPMYFPVPVPMYPMMGACPPCFPPPYPYSMMSSSNISISGSNLPPNGHNVTYGSNIPGGNNIPSSIDMPHLPTNESPITPDEHGVMTPNIPSELQKHQVTSSDYLYMYVGVPKNVMIKV